VLHCGHVDESLGQDAFQELQREIDWQTMFHRGGEVPRRVALQGSVGPSGEEPLYRHPADEQPRLVPWTPGVDRLRRATEALVGHPLNHGLLQLYRDGRDWIGSHADKTLDLIRPSFIVNVSLGATRTMVLRPKAEGRAQRIPLPHGSVVVMDLETNRRWLHEIRQQGAAGEIGPRISLTFRQIGSFWDPATQAVWGTGTPARLPTDHVPPTHAEALEESERLLRLFRDENQDPLFDSASYRPGFRIRDFHAWREAECDPSSM
jgi:alkylated DNA repair dioxygenase AlkB